MNITKNDLFNTCIANLSTEFDREQLDKIKINLLVTFSGYEVQAIKQLPSTEIHDNEFLFERFAIDTLAKGTKPSSIKTYMNMIKPFFDATGLNYTQVTAQDLTDYIARKQYTKNAKGHYPSQNYISTINRSFFVFFQWAYRKKHITEDIMLDVDRIRQKTKKKEKLTEEEIETCRTACSDSRELALYELMLSTGMRVGEIECARIEDIDFTTRTMSINGYKSDSSEREGYLSIKAKNAIKKYIGNRTSGPIFMSTKQKDTKLSKSAIELIAKKIGRQANVHCPTTVHVYRKTFACNLYKATKDVKIVSVMLGHANTAVTEKYYLIDDMRDIKYEVLKMAA